MCNAEGPPSIAKLLSFWHRKSVETTAWSVSKRPIVEHQPKSRSNRAREGVANGLSHRKTPFELIATLSFLEKLAKVKS